MPKRNYSPEDRKLVRRLLLLHGGNVPLVHQLTGFPARTVHNWRAQWDDDYELYTDALAQSFLARANAKAAIQSPYPQTQQAIQRRHKSKIHWRNTRNCAIN